jgi:hypothetical protein
VATAKKAPPMTFHPKKPGASVERVRRHLGIAAPRKVVLVPACVDAERNLASERARD